MSGVRQGAGTVRALSAKVIELQRKKREREMEQIMEAYVNSRKSLSEVLIFLEESVV